MDRQRDPNREIHNLISILTHERDYDQSPQDNSDSSLFRGLHDEWTAMGTTLWAQTGDDIVPAIEEVCDGDPFNFGLCNAYCEALDCDSATPIGSPRACERVLNNYHRHSDGIDPPCEGVVECPCEFDLDGDLNFLVAMSPAIIDLENWLFAFCEDLIENDGNAEDTYIAQAFEGDPSILNPTQRGVRLLYAVEDDKCSEVGGALDGLQEIQDPEDWYDFSSGRWIDNLETSLSNDEVEACTARLAELCDTIGLLP